MLDSHRPAGHEIVEGVAVECPGHALVIGDPPEPGPLGEVPVGLAEGGGESIPVVDVGGAEADRLPGGRGGVEVHVMVVQAGEDRAPGGLEDPVVWGDRQVRADRRDASRRDAHALGMPSPEVGPGDHEVRHERRRRPLRGRGPAG